MPASSLDLRQRLKTNINERVLYVCVFRDHLYEYK